MRDNPISAPIEQYFKKKNLNMSKPLDTTTDLLERGAQQATVDGIANDLASEQYC